MAAGASRADKEKMLERLKSEFFLPPLRENKYRLVQVVGEGAYGVVCSGENVETGEMVAVKRVLRVFDEIAEATRVLREVKFLRLLSGHENIVSIKEVMLPGDKDRFNDVFVVFELMPTDLSRVLRSGIELGPEHIRWMMYQLLRGVLFLHSARVFHRDLKPSNLLINAECDLRICDFGLARAMADNKKDFVFWTDYVATRWYRAPELIMSYHTTYTTAIDMWSVGCIFGEMLNGGQPMFPGMNGYHQLELFVETLGTPTPAAISKVRNTKSKEHLLSLERKAPRNLQEMFPKSDPRVLDLLKHLLDFDPDLRWSADQALAHEYFEDLHSPDHEPLATPVPESEFQYENTPQDASSMRRLFIEEALYYHPEKVDEYLAELNGEKGEDTCGYNVLSPADKFQRAMMFREKGVAERNYDSMPGERLDPIVKNARSNVQSKQGSNPKAGPEQKVAVAATVTSAPETGGDAPSLARTTSVDISAAKNAEPVAMHVDEDLAAALDAAAPLDDEGDLPSTAAPPVLAVARQNSLNQGIFADKVGGAPNLQSDSHTGSTGSASGNHGSTQAAAAPMVRKSLGGTSKVRTVSLASQVASRTAGGKPGGGGPAPPVVASGVARGAPPAVRTGAARSAALVGPRSSPVTASPTTTTTTHR